MTVQTLRGFLLTRNWRDTTQGLELEYWFSTDQGPARVLMSGQQSVFFLPVPDMSSAQPVLAAFPVAEIKQLPLKDFALTPVAAIYFNSYRQARRCADSLREAGLDPLEADINPADRYLMERYITGGALLQGESSTASGTTTLRNPILRSEDYRPSLRVASVDIETAMEGLQLYSIAIHGVDSLGETRKVFMVGQGAEQDYVQACDSQQEALEAFLAWLQDYDPDVLIGWNVINFDAWYLQRLADSLKIRLALGRQRLDTWWRQLDDDGERRTVQMPGRVFLDGIDLLRAAFYSFDSFSLENVSRQLLGEGKLLAGGERGGEITRLFVEDKTSLARYNLRDCELVSEIFAHTSLLEFAVARTVMTGLNIDRLGGSVASFDNLYLPRLHRAGYVAPNASSEHIASPGGYVLESQPGIYDHVLVLDFKSLYPSIIRTFNIDPLGLALGVSEQLSQEQTVEGFIGGRFAREGHILPGLIQQLWQRRDDARADQDAPLSQAIKIIMNSFYGVLGTPGCRFFDARLASSITRRGHEILQRTRDRIETLGYRVIYGDTDSVFVWVEHARDSEAAQGAGRQLQEDLNDWWRQLVRDEHQLDSVLELEFETHYRRFLMPTIRGSERGSKKRYAGLVSTADGEKLVFKGLENVRTDWTLLAREFQQELYQRIFYQRDYEQWLRDTVLAVLAGERDEQLVYRKRLRRKLDEYQRNIPPHVQAARLCVERGLPAPRRGSWVEYVITTAGAEPAGAARSPLDYQHYVDRQLEPVADGILGLLGGSFRDLVEKQITLF